MDSLLHPGKSWWNTLNPIGKKKEKWYKFTSNHKSVSKNDKDNTVNSKLFSRKIC